MTVLISVIIGTHNPEPAALTRTLKGLAAQSLPDSEWETIVVDNASNPPMEESRWREILPPMVFLREPRPGLSFARSAGIAKARGGIVVFVDDDNVLDPDYLSATLDFFTRHPEVGVAGGRTTPEFARPPAAWALAHAELFAQRDLGDRALISEHRHSAVKMYDYFAPFGGGLVLRRRFAQDFRETVEGMPAALLANVANGLVGRQGGQLYGCEDCDLVMCAALGGSQVAYIPELRLTHLIPERRLRFGYLSKLRHNTRVSFAQFQIRHGLAKPIPKWTVPLRKLRAFFNRRAWEPARYLAWRGDCGNFDGLAGNG